MLHSSDRQVRIVLGGTLVYVVCSSPQSTVAALYLRRLLFARATPQPIPCSTCDIFVPGGSYSVDLILKLFVWFEAVHHRRRSCSSDVVISVVDFRKDSLDFYGVIAHKLAIHSVKIFKRVSFKRFCTRSQLSFTGGLYKAFSKLHERTLSFGFEMATNVFSTPSC